MAKIPLRAYNREIDVLIERGQVEEAIAHCKYILKFYPKHLETYRLLAKAYLESQRYGEAADILRRILSVQPDDFIAQIGMSIIYEDEGNLDAAIFHMERAFEIQPSNIAVQDELRRLYGRRDGVEPPKLRLTRGALVRIYGRGELYRQAIAEARAALAEDPQRVDLEIVLAKMYFKNGQKVEATEISSRLISKLPYCMEAIRILADTLRETSRAEEAKIYHEKLVALEPYLAYVEAEGQDVGHVPDNAVTLDRLEWTPSLEAEQPAWAQDLGLRIEGQEGEQTPSWMATLPGEAEPSETTGLVPPFSEEPELYEQEMARVSDQSSLETIETAEPELPDWMQSAGWKITTEPEEKTPVEMGEEEAAPAEIPDWLKEVAPDLPSLEEHEKTSGETIEVTAPEEQIQAPSEAPSVLVPLAIAENPILEAPAQPADELPDWLKEIQSEQVDESTFVASDEPIPDWLTLSEQGEEISQEDEEIGMVGEAELPAVSAEVAEIEAPSAKVAEVETPSIEAAEGEITSEEITELEPAQAEIAEAGMTLAEAEAPEAAIPSVETSVELPLPQAEPVNEGLVEGEVPPVQIAPQPAPEELAATSVALSETIPSAELQDLSDQTPLQIETSEEVSEEPVASTLDEDAAFAWLESLAAKQGANSETLLVSPEERTENPPEWVQQQVSESGTEQVTAAEKQLESVSPVNETEAVEQIAESELPKWLKALEQEETPVENVPSVESLLKIEDEPQAESLVDLSQETADWVQEIEESVIPETELPAQGEGIVTLPEATPESSETGKTGPLPSWLISPTPQPPDENIVLEPGTLESPLPAWMAEERESPSVEEIQPRLESNESPPLPAWLQELETEQPQMASVAPVSEPPTAQIPFEHMLIGADTDQAILDAQSYLANGQLDRALALYNQLISSGQKIEETIHDLRDALYRYPIESSLWQTLGDAYMRSEHIQDALDAYTKAEELLR